MRIWRNLVGAIVLASSLVGVTVASPGPAAAELVTPQATSWGLANEAPNSNLDRWAALGWATEAVGGMMVVGGKFADVTNGQQSYPQPYLAAFDAGDGSFLTWWRPDVGGAVTALETTPDGGLMVGGEMGTWNGATIGALQKIDPTTGDPWPGWSTRVYGSSSIVRDVRLEPDGWLYVVGSFTTASDSGVPFAVNGALRMDPVTGAIDRTWLPQPAGGSVWGVSKSRTLDEVYLAGWFTAMNGAANTRGFAGVSSTDATILHDRSTVPFNTCTGCTAYHRLYDVVATEYGNVWVGGEQHGLFVLDETSNLSMDLMHYTNCNRNLRADCKRTGGEFQEIERIGDRIYATCHCWADHMTSTQTIIHGNYPTGTFTGIISGVAAYDPVTGQRIQSFNPYMAGKTGGFAVAQASDGCLWVGGSFTAVGTPGSQSPGRDLVRLCDETGPGPDPLPNPTPPSPVACSTSVVGTTVTVGWTNPVGAEAVVVERQVGVTGTWSWRGVVEVSGTSFVEDAPIGAITSYRVQAQYPGGAVSVPIECAPPVDLTAVGSAGPPVSCAATNIATAATISWIASPGSVDFRVYRSINGGTNNWRGLTSATSFADTLRTSGTHSYSVQARGASGVWSTSTICSPALIP